MATTSNNKTLLGIKEEGKQKKQINRSSICGKKLKKNFKRKRQAEKEEAPTLKILKGLLQKLKY